MPITKESYVERVLIVLNADGTLKGAHSQTLDKILEDGILLRETQGDAVGVDATALASLLPDQATLVAQVQAITTERDALQAQVDVLKPLTDINGVPQEVSMYQARAALVVAGLYDAVNAAVAASADQMVKVAWEYATTVRRHSQFIAALAPVLNLDDTAIDQLFITAATIN